MFDPKEMVLCWLESAKIENATHLMVVFDVIDNDTFPVYVQKGQDANQIHKQYETGLLRVLEIYNMNMNIEKQYFSKKSFNL